MSSFTKLHYTLDFEPIQNKNGKVCFVDHSKNEKYTIGINVDDSDFKYYRCLEFPSLIADIIDLAVAIHGSDRLIPHPFDKPPCQINVILPVRNPDLLNSQLLKEKLEDLMCWATGNDWKFTFKTRIKRRSIEEQKKLDFFSDEVDEVALWSGGLDALAGLYNRIINNPQGSFILCGSGSNDRVFNIQKNIFNTVDLLLPNELKLHRIPIRFCDSKKHEKNKISRARGVVFMLIGSACAYLSGKRILNVYENGIGAINLPYRSSALGLDHTRSVHPKTLFLISDLLSTILDEPFKVQNPFLFFTKAKMCQTLVKDNKINLAFLTKSCDRHLHEKQSQCGYCSSCLLRKQSLAAAGIEDKTHYFVSHGNKPIKKDIYSYFYNMIDQVNTFNRLLSVSGQFDQQWESLTSEFTQLDYEVLYYLENDNLTRTDIQKLLLKLYQSYVDEWKQVKSVVKASLIPQKNPNLVSPSQVITQLNLLSYNQS